MGGGGGGGDSNSINKKYIKNISNSVVQIGVTFPFAKSAVGEEKKKRRKKKKGGEILLRNLSAL